MKKWMMVTLFLVLLGAIPTIGSATEAAGQASLIVKSSSQSLHQTVLKVRSEKIVQALFQATQLEKVDFIPFTNHYVLLEDRGTIRIYTIDVNGDFFDVQQKRKLKVDPNAAKKITSYFRGLHEHHFGTLLKWEEIDEIIPRYTTFTITDLETGLRFKAQRRAGSNHADVQPLTKADTAIMKEAYGGKWSWKRRAILVHHNGQALAASMHGMPHGGGALANGFPGHFCIHFKDSLTHSTRSLDLSHQLMVYKAGGILSPYVKQLSAQEVIETFFIALNQHDLDLLKLIYNEDLEQAEEFINEVELIRLTSNKRSPTLNGDLIFEIPLSFIIKQKDKKERASSYTFRLKRESITDGWTLDGVRTDQLLRK
ncbi:hypothetical protein [Halalkalibacter alkalisediminis]|uniref:Uncharacterized protein n=1 Tax=Halalkalibacter alkalisediminis TaxID=935616 RepID=A0ABV6NIE6_9BACI|nr:hypothetical protein [Halalkalibacter alkalisediminis]